MNRTAFVLNQDVLKVLKTIFLGREELGIPGGDNSVRIGFWSFDAKIRFRLIFAVLEKKYKSLKRLRDPFDKRPLNAPWSKRS